MLTDGVRWVVQSAVADRNVSETIYMAESLYLRYDIPFIMQPVMQALSRRGFNMSAINSTHVLFTVCCARVNAPIRRMCIRSQASI